MAGPAGHFWHSRRVEITPIGWVRSSRGQPLDDDWDSVTCSIVLDSAQLEPAALDGLDRFSHIEVIYLFDRVDPAAVERGHRHPRGNPEWPEVGILAQRAKNRPNRLGLSRCRLTSVDRDELTLRVRDLDAIDASPVLDVKPWIQEFGPRGPIRQPDWVTELTAGYWSTRPQM